MLPALQPLNSSKKYWEDQNHVIASAFLLAMTHSFLFSSPQGLLKETLKGRKGVMLSLSKYGGQASTRDPSTSSG